ncbi:hypothetical protein ACFL2Q_00110 [Thermodesulfobacteriota bacterium]
MEKDGVKSVEDWQEEMQENSKGKRGDFRLLSRQMLNSEAFRLLSRSGMVCVLAMLDELRYEKRKKGRKGVRLNGSALKDQGRFVITINELVARGLSRSSATRGRKEAWQLGFFDVEQSGSIHHAGRFRYSERWKDFPKPSSEPTGQQPPGRNIYPQSGFFKKKAPENQ